MKKTKQSKVLGEADYPHHAKVYLPTTRGGYERVWVKITIGTKFMGRGIIDSEPKNAVAGNIKLKLGDEIEYAGGTGAIIPKFVKRFRGNKIEVLKADLVKDLVNCMSFNPRGAV